VLLRQRGRDLEHLHPDDVQTFLFEAAKHAAHQAALHAVGLEQDQSAFHLM
jgi:hypothetical protein